MTTLSQGLVASNKAVYTRFVEEVINGGDSSVVADLFHEGYRDNNPPPGAPQGLEAVRMVPALFRGAFPDVHFTIEQMVGEGDKVATRVVGTGTHEGPFLGVEPTGKRCTWASFGIFRVQDGKIAEHWGIPDLLDLMQQLGVVPDDGAQGNRTEIRDAAILAGRAWSPMPTVDPAVLQANKVVVGKVYDDGFTQMRYDVADEVMAPDYVDHPPARFFSVERAGADSLREDLKVFHQGFPDLVCTADDMVAEGDLVACRGTWQGTHDGDFFTIKRTGKPFKVSGINFFRLRDGRIAERWGLFDALSMMQQLGLAPAPGGPPEG